VKDWLIDKKQKYLHGWERQTTLVLLGAAVLLTIHRYLSRRRFFSTYLAEYFIDHPLAGIYPHFYWFLTTAITLVVFPMLLVKFGIRDRIRDYGCRLSGAKLGWGFVLVGWLLMIPLMLLAVQIFPSFVRKYPLNKMAATSWKLFIPYEISYGIYMFSWEFFFRGFMLFGLEKRFGNYSILIQTIPFAVMHYAKPFPEAMGSIFAGLLLGVIAFETRSFIYGAAIHWLVAMSMDIIALMSR
jgi:uncharacterized protein